MNECKLDRALLRGDRKTKYSDVPNNSTRLRRSEVLGVSRKA